MLAAQRHEQILNLLRTEGYVQVKNLSARFGVTEDCIRKDLTVLSKKGLLEKTHGGARTVRTASNAYHVEDRLGKHTEDKTAIAAKAMELIQDNDTVFLDISTSNIELARLLVEKNMHVTLVTNCVEVMRVINVPCNITLIGLGGQLSSRRDGFVGGLTNRQLENYRFDIAFMGAVGADPEGDAVSTFIPEDGESKRFAMERSKKTYLMLETRKFREYGSYNYAQLSSFTGLILETKPNAYILKQLGEYSLELYIAG